MFTCKLIIGVPPSKAEIAFRNASILTLKAGPNFRRHAGQYSSGIRSFCISENCTSAFLVKRIWLLHLSFGHSIQKASISETETSNSFRNESSPARDKAVDSVGCL